MEASLGDVVAIDDGGPIGVGNNLGLVHGFGEEIKCWDAV